MPEINTKQQWQDAVEEFGDRAFERFFINHGGWAFSPISNEEAEEAIEDLNQLNQIPLPYLFEHDASVYGDKAFLMWEWKNKQSNNIKAPWRNFHFNFDCESQISNLDWEFFGINIRRKASAELPFDLKRAKAGDVVEIFVNYWKTCLSKTFELRKFPLIQLDNISVSKFNLRMKYLPKLEIQK